MVNQGTGIALDQVRRVERRHFGPGALGRGDNAVGFLHGDAHRLLDDDRLARFQRVASDLGVEVVGQRHDHKVAVLGAVDVAVVLVPGGVVLTLPAETQLGIGIADGAEP